VAHRISQADGLRLTLMVEELFTNTVKHGHGADSDAAVRLALREDPTHVELFYEDRAPAFNPLSRVMDLPGEGPAGVDSRGVGGVGIVLVAHMATTSRYAYEDGCNRLWLSLRRGA
jgi:anti-sigma regulatory factor (Ser/Thr protein kinase)